MKMLPKNAELDNFCCEVEKVFLGALIMNTPARAILTHNFILFLVLLLPRCFLARKCNYLS